MHTRSRSVFNILSLFALLASLLAGALTVTPVHAAGITVNSSADNTTEDDLCTLREAITTANSDAAINSGGAGNDCTTGSGTDTITLPGGTYTLASTLPNITSTIIINGNGAATTIIQANAVTNTATYRVFYMLSSFGNLTLDSLTVRNGRCNGSCATSTIIGGGIFNHSGILTLLNSTVSGNVATAGGGIASYYGSVIVTNSTISGNTAAESGGGIVSSTGNSLSVTNSVFSSNTSSALESGGAIYSGGLSLTVTDSAFSSNSAYNGGGISAINGTLSVTNSTFATNTAANSGGGLELNGATTVTVANSTFSGNTATGGSGGGIDFNAGGPLTVTNSTFANNSAYYGGGISAYQNLTVTNSTFANNSAVGGGFGGGIYTAPGFTTTLYNTIIADNTDSTVNGDCYTDGTLTALSNNMDTDGSCDSATQQTSVQLSLGALANNGGATQTLALGATSTAINTGDNATCESTDQRGVSRPQGSVCDIGAYELVLAGPTSLVNSVLPTSRTPVVGNPVTIFNTVINSGSETAVGVTLSMNPAPAGTFSYFQTNCATNAIISAANPAIDIAPAGVACYVLVFTPSASFNATQVHIQAQASNAPSTNLLSGINTWLLRATNSAGPDIIALTTTTDFHQVACSGTNFFAVAMSNVGTNAIGDITVSANTGSVSLPINISIQETNPGTGAIIGDNILQSVLAGQNRTVLVTVTFTGCVSFDPAANRIFIEFRDGSNNILGSTSTAVSTNR